MNAKTELKYAKVAFVVYLCIFLAIRLWHSYSMDRGQSDSDRRDILDQILSEMDSQQRKRSANIRSNDAFHKTDSALDWIHDHVDSFYPGLKDSIYYKDYKNLTKQNLDLDLRRHQYTLDCLEFNMNYIDSHLRAYGLSQFDSVQKLRDSLVEAQVEIERNAMSEAETAIRVGEYLAKYMYLPLILLFPGRWLINYIIKKGKKG